MRMNLIEMHKCVWQLGENDFGIAAAAGMYSTKCAGMGI
jgi:hypothetical protein